MTDATTHDEYEVVIGLEIHCQLQTSTKIFSGATTTYGAPPNTQIDAVDIGLPGSLPVLNARAVELAILAGLGTNCQVQHWSQFARKNYFYADLPKGYQISQHTHPICRDGWLDVEVDGHTSRVRIERIHMEEDAGKSTHVSGQPHSLIDYNRAGTPLIEVVTHPDMRSADQAVAFMRELYQIVTALGVCDGNMEQGSFRCDANVSVRKRGDTQLGTRTELKNINSFKFVRDAITYEQRRQIALIESGQRVVQQTMLYDPNRGQTIAMRSKEDAHDYRYFPEPDLPPLVIPPEQLAQLAASMPELPPAKRSRYQEKLGLSPYDAAILANDRAVSNYFEQALAHYDKNPKLLANWVINEVLREVKAELTLETIPARPPQLAALVKLIDDEVVSGKIAKQLFEEELLASGADPVEAVERRGLKQLTDPDAILAIIDPILEKNQAKVQEYRDGKVAMFGFFVGQVMKASQGKANPKVVNELLTQRLNS
jgi:aspartyl-tRNA(Asn)/glutamyl-tRNA(Gln) amidotransferase subunit B